MTPSRIVFLAMLCLTAACGARAPDTATISGELVYRERIMLPPNAVIRVQLQDVTRQDVAALQISEVSFVAEGGPPYAFELQYLPEQIQPQGRYALRGSIKDGDRLIFVSDTHIPAFQEGPVEILVRSVQAPRPGPR